MQFGRYEVISEMGRGAMGIVYKAKDPIIDRIVAIKTIQFRGQNKPIESEFRQRFLREGKAAGTLHHPNLVTIYDAGEEDGIPYIAMEHIEGESLTSLITRKARVPAVEAVSIIRQVAQGLGYAHRQGIIHRDIKTDNILIESSGRAVITDFGVARLSSSTMTQTGELLGTPAFMSPEQVLGDPIDGRSDIFSLGICFYYALAGKRPFKGDTISSICYHIVHSPPLPLPDGCGIPDVYKQMVLKLLSKKKEERYQTCAEFLDSLDKPIPTKITTPSQDQIQTVLLPESAPIKKKKIKLSIMVISLIIIFLIISAFLFSFFVGKIKQKINLNTVLKNTEKTANNAAEPVQPPPAITPPAILEPPFNTSSQVKKQSDEGKGTAGSMAVKKLDKKGIQANGPTSGIGNNPNNKAELTGETITSYEPAEQKMASLGIIFETKLKSGKLLIRVNDKREIDIPFESNKFSEGRQLSRITKTVKLPPGKYNFTIAVISLKLREPITQRLSFSLEPGKKKIFKIEARPFIHDIVIKEIEP